MGIRSRPSSAVGTGESAERFTVISWTEACTGLVLSTEVVGFRGVGEELSGVDSTMTGVTGARSTSGCLIADDSFGELFPDSEAVNGSVLKTSPPIITRIQTNVAVMNVMIAMFREEMDTRVPQ